MCRSLLFSTVIVFAATICYADLPNVSIDLPDIHSSEIAIRYDADTQLFTAIGSANWFTRDFVAFNDIWMDSSRVTNGEFNLTATIDNSGTASGGRLDIAGWVDGMSQDPGKRALLTATLVDFGYRYTPPEYDRPLSDDPGNATFGFILTDLGGDLAGAYGGQDARIGVFVGMPIWREPFGSATGFSGTGGADTCSIVPTPSSGLLLGSMPICLALAALVRGRRRHTKSSVAR